MSDRNFVIILVASALMASPLCAKEDTPIVLEPSSPWHLNMGKNHCRITRTFGEGDDKNIFYLEQWGPATVANWLVSGPAIQRFKHSRAATLAFNTDGHTTEFTFPDISLGNFGKSVVGMTSVVKEVESDKQVDSSEIDYTVHPRGLPRLDNAAAAKIDSFTLTQKGRGSVTLQLGAMGKPLAAMNHCMDDLVKSWGLDPIQQRNVARPPMITNLSSVVRRIQKEYPRKAEQARAQANFYLRLMIDANGRISQCTLSYQTMAEEFGTNDHPCKVFEQTAKIEPALDVTGAAVASYYTNRILYAMN